MKTPIPGRTRLLSGALKGLEPAIEVRLTGMPCYNELRHFDEAVCGPTGLANAVWYLLGGNKNFPTIRIVRARRGADGVWECVDEARFGLSGWSDDDGETTLYEEVRWDAGNGPNGLGSHSVIGQGPFSDNAAAVACEIMSWLADPELTLFWVKDTAA